MKLNKWNSSILGDVVKYANSRISVDKLSAENYISTENMLPNRGGIVLASSLPTGNAVKYYKGQTLVSNIRPYFKKIWHAKNDGGCSADVLVFEIINDVDDKFFYYYLSQENFFEYVMAGSKGTKMPRGDKQQILMYPFSYPSKKEQKAIAATLSCLDDKIELNNRMNKNLEEMAQAIFKSWFVDFEPFQDGEFEESEFGMIPKGWRVGTLGDYVKIKSGYAFKSSWWESDGVPVIKIKDINNGTIDFSDIAYVSPEKINIAKDFIVSGGEVLIAMTGATIGKFGVVPKLEEPALVNQRVGKFFLGDKPLSKIGFLYCNLKQEYVYNEIVSKGDGSAQPNVSPTGIESIKIVLPPVEIVDKFNYIVQKNFEKIIENYSNNSLIVNVRDTLLPKLMSGEIRVPIEEVQ